MALLAGEPPQRIDHRMRHHPAWRSGWPHRASPDPVGELPTPRDRGLPALVATSPLGVNPGAAARHRRRSGTSPARARAGPARLVHTGHLSWGPDLRRDRPVLTLQRIHDRVPGAGGA